MKNVLNQPKYETLAFFMLGLLTIPHSNSECERIFSQVRKNKTDFRGSLSNDSLSSILVTKSFMEGKCCDQKFSADLLKRAKGATQAHVKRNQQ